MNERLMPAILPIACIH